MRNQEDRRVVIWTTPERKGLRQPWLINQYTKRDEPAQPITKEDIHRYICPWPRAGEAARIRVQAQLADINVLSSVWVDINRTTDLDFEATYRIGSVVSEVVCFVADEVQWSEADSFLAWEKVDHHRINLRICQARARVKMSMAEFDRKVEEQPFDEELHEYQLSNKLPTHEHWRRVANALGVSSQWLVYGEAMLDADREAAKQHTRWFL